MSSVNWSDDKLLFRILNNKSDQSRWENIKKLRSRPSEALLYKCIELSKSDNSFVRKLSIDILIQFGSPPREFGNQIFKICLELLKTEKDPQVINSLLYVFGHNNNNIKQEDVTAICSFIKYDNFLIKQGLVFALLGIENKIAVNTLIELSSDKSSYIRNWATFGLGTQIERNNKKIRAALWARVNDRHQETKLEAIVGLATRKDTRVIEIIKREIIKCKYGTLLFVSIINFPNKEYLPLLKQNFKDFKEDETINPDWINGLENCINIISKKFKQ